VLCALNRPPPGSTLQRHDPEIAKIPLGVNVCEKMGVRIEESRPLSRLKRWRLVEIVKKGEQVEKVQV